MADLTTHIQAITAQLKRTTQPDSLDRELTRGRLIFDMLYDDEESEPDQAIRDCLTTLMHVAADRGVDIEEAIRKAAHMCRLETEDWGPQDD